jgi:CHAT domain-containing protein
MSLQTVPTVDEIVETFRSSDSATRVQFVEACPPTSTTDLALMSAGMDMPAMRCQSLDFLASGYSNTGPLDYATNFGAACYRLSSEEYDSEQPHDSAYMLCAGRGAINWMTALQREGRHEDVLTESANVLGWLTSVGDTSNVASVQFKQIESFLDLQRFDDAEGALASIRQSQLTDFNRLNYRTLRERLMQRKGSATKLPEEARDPQGALNRIFDMDADAPAPLATGGATKRTKEDVEQLVGLSDIVLKTVFKGGTGELVERQEIINASSLFADPVAGYDPARIAESEAVLLRARDWMRDHNFPENESDACWGLYLCYSRTNRDSLAVDQLQRIRANTEAARLNIADPVERAELSARFPFLYPSLCTLLYKLGRQAEMLEAIEASKGRVLADIVALRGGKAPADRALSDAIERLPALITKMKAHYLTFLVDTDCTFAASVAPDGSVRASKIECGEREIRRLATALEEHARNTSRPSLPDKYGDGLAPFVQHFESVVQRRIARNTPHLCYSPDGDMHLLPLQCATFAGEPLARTFAVSRTHGAHFIVELMQKAAYRPKRFVAVEVPAEEDRKSIDKLRALRTPVVWLRDHVPEGETIAGADADLERLAALRLSTNLVHFATHGVFPLHKDRGKNANPYDASGLLLAAGGKLPSLEAAAKGGERDHLLTPRLAVERALDLSRCHVTLQACVSGLAREGIGGDALGLEWSLLQRGASSILATQWDVRADTTSEFVTRFYRRWLKEGQTRARAWQDTVCEFMDSGTQLAKPSNWAAFSLSGDWR